MEAKALILSWLKNMRKINKIIIHCSATNPNMDIGSNEIKKWHTDRGWLDIGYHYVIRRNGDIENGRNISIQGAHARGYNSDSVGICLVGGIDSDGLPDSNFTRWQLDSLETLVSKLKNKYHVDDLDIIGHRDVSIKACPCFDVQAWWSTI